MAKRKERVESPKHPDIYANVIELAPHNIVVQFCRTVMWGPQNKYGSGCNRPPKPMGRLLDSMNVRDKSFDTVLTKVRELLNQDEFKCQ
jgi:hypothetical protein